jgi:hypothetical protein
MGTYVYRVTGIKVKCSDGVLANVAKFAYKPYWGMDRDKANAKLHFRSGATSSDAQAWKGNITERFVIDSTVYANTTGRGTFYDDYLGSNQYPVLEGVTAQENTNG